MSVQLNTRLRVLDNSGARLAYCIKVLKKANAGSVGDEICCVVKEVVPGSQVKVGEVHRGIIVRTRRVDYQNIGFGSYYGNKYAMGFERVAAGVVLLKKDGSLRGTRISEIVSPYKGQSPKIRELWTKIRSMAKMCL
eukprot:Colp12_sorted_trinity150504_noHs@33121